MANSRLLGSLVLFAGVAALAQSSAPPVTPTQAGGWHQVEGLGPHSRIIVKTDKQTTACFVHLVEEQELTCSRSEEIGSETLTFPRSDVKSIKLATGSKLGGMALGLTDKVMSPADEMFAGMTIYQR